ncbi:MAG TPA: S8 family peptidase [Candidatus Limnocylindrales bacterium]
MAQRRARTGRSAAALLIAAALLAPVLIPATASAGRGQPHQRGSGPNRGALLVKMKPSAGAAAAAAAASAAGGTEIGRLTELDTSVVEAPAGRQDRVRRQLLADPNVLAVEPDGQAQAAVVPSDPLWSRQWSARRVRAPLAWDVTTGQSSTIVAVLDTGVDANHPDLRGKVLAGWNFQANNANTYDDGNHGTPVAGLIAGLPNNGKGIAGMCWRCRILPVKVLNSAGSGSWSNIAAGVVWAANNGADVINLSLGGQTGSRALRDAIAYAIGKGVVVVAAAGNNGSRNQFYPAAYPNVMAVAATTNADALYSFSNRGSWVDISAPGCTWSSAPRAKWRSFCGTSAAAPIVAGIAGLVRSRAPNASRAAVQAAITSTTVPVGAIVRHGRVDAAAAVRVLGTQAGTPADPTPKPTPTATPKPTPTPTGSAPGEGEEYWSDRLHSDRDTDRQRFRFGGHVEFEVRWSNWRDLRVEVRTTGGETVFVRDGDGWWHEGRSRARFDTHLPPGEYDVIVSADFEDATYFEMKVSWQRD